MKIKTNIGQNLCNTIGKSVTLNGKECGKIIEYNSETGEATLEMDNSFSYPSHTPIFCSSRAKGSIIEDTYKDENNS